MRSSGSGSRSTDPGGRHSSGSKKGANSTSAGQADARSARLASRGSGPVNAKDDGMGEAARSLAQHRNTGAAAADTTPSRKRVLQADQSDDDDGDSLEAAGVVNVSQIVQKLKRASNQPVHAFLFDCNSCLTHHSIFFAGKLEQYLRQRQPASPEHSARARPVQGARHPEQGHWPQQRCLAVLTVAVTVVTGPR